MANLEVGYSGKVEVADDTNGSLGTWVALGATSEGEITPKNNTADVTQVNQAGFEQRLPTTQDADIKASVFLLSGSADPGYTKCLTSLKNRVEMWIRVWRDATTYNLARVYCTSVPSKIDPKNPVKVEFSFAFSGNPNGYTINNLLTGSPYAATVILGIA
jgi:hypothetical protein